MHIEIDNALGNTVMKVFDGPVSDTSFPYHASLASLPSGSYYLRVISGNYMVTKRLVIEH